jgi:predicted MFS family arabinose efflux permease
MVTGPIVASYWGMSGIFWLTAILAAIGIIAVLLVVPNPSVRHSGHEVVPVPAMLTRVLADRQLLRVNAGIFFLHFAQIATWVVIPVMLENSFDFHRDQHWMLYLATMGGGFVLMLPFVWYAETRHKLKPVFIGAIAVLAIAEGVMATTGSLFQQLVFGLLLFFVAFNLLEATLPSLVSKLAPAGIKGTAMGVYSTSQFLGTFVGGLVGGVVAFRYGGSALFVVVMASVLIWLTIAITMRAPRVLRSIEIDLRADSGVDIKSNMINIKGIEDIVVIPGENIAYVKVDDEQFDEAVFDRQIQQYINQK